MSFTRHCITINVFSSGSWMEIPNCMSASSIVTSSSCHLPIPGQPLSPCTCDRVCTTVLASKNYRFQKGVEGSAHLSLRDMLIRHHEVNWLELYIDGCGRGMWLTVMIVINNASICMSTMSKCITVCSLFFNIMHPALILL